MKMCFKGKTVVVTGGAKGIGAETVRAFAESGANVVFTYNTSSACADSLISELKDYPVCAFKADLTDQTACDELKDFTVANFGKADILVNNAGSASYGILPLLTDTDKVINDSLKTCINVSKAFYDVFVSNKEGCIVNVSSVWGIAGSSCETAYSAAKAGIIGFTKALAKELAPSNVRVNAVAPGVIMTDMMKRFTEDEIKDITGDIPLGRTGTGRDVASAVLFLSSPLSSYITGEILNVSGGYVI